MRYFNQQMNNFEALPIEVRNSALTEKQMGVLNVLYRMSTMEASKANPDGSFFASQAKLIEETGYAKNTITDIRSNFDACGFITTQKGTWEGRKATTFILHKDVVMEWANNHPRIGEVKQRRAKKNGGIGSVIGSVNKCPDENYNCPDEENQTLRDEVKQLREVVTSQNQRITALEEVLSKLLNGSVIGSVNTNSIGSVTDNCPTESEIEITNHIEPYSNTIENNDYRADTGEIDKATFKKVEGNDPDEVAPSNMGETGDVAIFNKIEGEVTQSQPEETTPDDEQTTIEYLTNLEMTLRDCNTNLNHDEVIATSNELKAILDKWGQSSHIVELTTNRIANLIHWFTFDINALGDVRNIFTPHLRDNNANPSQIAHNIADHYKELKPQDAGNALIWTMTPSMVQTTTNEEKTRQMQNKVANPVSGNADLNPQNTEEPQAKQNKAAGSVSAPQMGKLSTDITKRAQTSPESPTMAMEKDEVANNDILQLGRANQMYENNDENASRLADETANHLIRYIPQIESIAKLNWCRYYINRAFEEWGWVLESNAAFYLAQINKKLDEREAQLLAA